MRKNGTASLELSALSQEDIRLALLRLAREGTYPVETIMQTAVEHGVVLLRRPDLARLNPSSAMRWTLGMVVAWISTRNNKAVAWFWRPFTQQCQSWTPSGSGFAPGPWGAPLSANWLLGRWSRTPFGDEAEFNIPIGFPNPFEAFDRLKNASQEGHLVGSGYDFRASKGASEIDPAEWPYLDLAIGPDGSDLLNIPPAAPHLSQVTFPRSDVERLWPPLDAPSQIYTTSSPKLTYKFLPPSRIIQATAQITHHEKLPRSQVGKTGAPGRPTSMHLVENELDQRIAAGVTFQSVEGGAQSLAEWLRSTHPDKPPAKAKSIKNKLASKIRRAIAT